MLQSRLYIFSFAPRNKWFSLKDIHQPLCDIGVCVCAVAYTKLTQYSTQKLHDVRFWRPVQERIFMITINQHIYNLLSHICAFIHVLYILFEKNWKTFRIHERAFRSISFLDIKKHISDQSNDCWVWPFIYVCNNLFII